MATTVYFTKGPKKEQELRMKVRIYYDPTGNTLTIWLDDPAKEAICEEIGDDVVLMKDCRGRVIGFERLNYLSRKQQDEGGHVPVEVQVL
jgi:uncharacterized protein YuzE